MSVQPQVSEQSLGEMEDHLVSLQKSIETRLKELEIEKTRVKKLLKELESKEKEIDLVRNFDFGFGSMAGMDGKELLGFLNGYVGQQEKLHDGIFQALKSCEEPEKLVLDAVKKFHSVNGEMDIGEGTVWKRSCVVLLEQLTRLRPKIVPPDVKAEAARLAREWRAKMKMEEGQKGVLEVDQAILHSRPKVEPSQSQSGYSKLDNQAISFPTDPWPQLESFCISMDGRGSNFLSHEKVKEHDSVASSSTSPWPELKSLCINMDGKSLRLFLYNHAAEHDFICSEVCDALQYASDPAKLVLDAIPGILSSQPDFDKSLSLNKVRKSCVLLLEQLINISPEINPQVKEEALMMANEWRANLGPQYQAGLNVYGFLHFIVAYGFTSNYEADELLGLLVTANQHKASPGLCQILGLADKVEVLIKNLIQKTLLLEAIEHIYAFEVKDMFQPVHLLKDYLKQSTKQIYKKGTKSVSRQAIDKEIDAVRTVIRYIAKLKLESEYRPQILENYIVQPEKKKRHM
ncbi:hypothetical protein L484_010216 [Morus notabilis]|uniref:FRIGIDA-like protein n=1 Tax=Morus notabilis TaxID=981085 RepID=W9R449_9ROSA|nr:hypothetical protein L484_010216 [Morus notabilis]